MRANGIPNHQSKRGLNTKLVEDRKFLKCVKILNVFLCENFSKNMRIQQEYNC